MRWRKVDWLFVLFAGAVVIGVSFLPTPNTSPLGREAQC